LPSPRSVSGEKTWGAEKGPNGFADPAAGNAEAFCVPEHRLENTYERMRKGKYRVYPFGNYVGVRVQLRAVTGRAAHLQPQPHEDYPNYVYTVNIIRVLLDAVFTR
jgi:hypothetical protein